MTYSVFDWIAAMRRLNCNKHHGAIAPHKPVLLLAVMAEIERGALTNCFVPLTEQMKQAFETQWRLHVPSSGPFHPTFATPFFHMTNEGFWELMPKRHCNLNLAPGHTPSLKQLHDNFYGAYIEPSLFDCMCDPGSRALLRRALLETYFPASLPDSTHGFGSIAADPGESKYGFTNKAQSQIRA